MISQIYTLKDSQTETFNTPIHVHNEEHAIASLRLYIVTGDMEGINPLHKDLFHLGSFDDNTGRYKMLDAPRHVLNLRTLAPKFNKKSKKLKNDLKQNIIQPSNKKKVQK